MDTLPSAKDFTPTLTLPLKGEGIFAQLRKSYFDVTTLAPAPPLATPYPCGYDWRSKSVFEYAPAPASSAGRAPTLPK